MPLVPRLHRYVTAAAFAEFAWTCSFARSPVASRPGRAQRDRWRQRRCQHCSPVLVAAACRPSARACSPARRQGRASFSSAYQEVPFSTDWSAQTMTRINLTAKEEQVCDLLDAFTNDLNTSKDAGSKTELRIAGGWVRDKLLGRDSHDLDVAINNMVGYEFARALTDYIASHEADAPTMSSVGKIISNPERSKHLETATMRIADLECDFVNLRNETYAGDSRIPMMTFGTPTEDAYRRDITINALFFNVHTRQVEDFTGKGLQDLREGLIRTPLPSRETFRDDPLRVLRVLRFASRFGFRMVPEILDSVHDSSIKEALSAKISKERIFTEVDKMLGGPDPVQSVDYICDFGLYPVLFALPAQSAGCKIQPASFDATAVKAAQDTVRVIEWLTSNPADDVQCPFRLAEPLLREDLRQLHLTALLVPLHNAFTPKDADTEELFKSAIREALCLSTYDIVVVTSMLEKSDQVHKLVVENAQNPAGRSRIGLFLRELASLPQLKGRWQMNVLFSLVRQLLPHVQSDTRPPWQSALPDTVSSVIACYSAFFQRINDLGLGDCWKWKPILNGHVVLDTLAIPPNSRITSIMADVMVWQLDHPEGSAEQCKVWLIERWGPRAAELRVTASQSAKKKRKVLLNS